MIVISPPEWLFLTGEAFELAFDLGESQTFLFQNTKTKFFAWQEFDEKRLHSIGGRMEA